MKKILVPTDFSDCADKALHYAIGLAENTSAEIILLHACDLLHYPFADRADLVQEYNTKKKNELLGRLDTLKEKVATPSVKISTQLYDGEITDGLQPVLYNEKVDLIVMGTFGATGLKTVLFGTKTANLIAKCAVPIITIPFDYEWKKPENIFIAINDEKEDIALFEPVFQLAKHFESKITVAVFSPDQAPAYEVMNHSKLLSASFDKLKKNFPEINIDMEHLSGKDFFNTVQQYENERKIDLLVMITHKRNLIQNLFRFSMTRQMSYHTTVPLLSLHSTHNE